MGMLLLVGLPSLEARTLTVNLEWTSGSQGTDLDLLISNPKNEWCYWGNRNTDWGATHTKDDRGEAGKYSYESFTVDLDAMDCYASGDYVFYIDHYSGPSLTSTISVDNGQSWNFTTSQGDFKQTVHYPANQDNCSSTPSVKAVFVDGIVPHYYEFDSSENPKGHYWCGHTALKSVGEYITDDTKTLGDIHNTFHKNSAGYRANNYCYTGKSWCAKLQDLMWASQLSQNGGYGRGDSVVRTIDREYSTFFRKVKDGVNNNYPPIIPSNWHYNNAGHFWVITGYKDTGNVENSILYLRDVALKTAQHDKYDWDVTVKKFLDSTNHSEKVQILYMK